MRIYEFSKNLGVANKEIVEVLKKQGFDVTNHMSVLSDQALAFLKNRYSPQSAAVPASKKSEETTVNISDKALQPKRLPIQEKPLEPQPSPAPSVQKNEPSPEKLLAIEGFVVMPMTISQVAQKMERPINEIMLTLLKQGTLATKNQVLPAKIVEQLAHHYQVPIIAALQQEQPERRERAVTGDNVQMRQPVVVVVGHVDHGKTTLLDFIRKTKVAVREHGGITQHLGAYQVKTPQGDGIVFLDTPGHAAFIKMRARGVKVADIAILVIAADDGIMPQTVEAIKHAKNIKVPLIVAINKIDKATPLQIEAVKRGLASHDLLPEEWGGQVICVPICAKTGQGIDQLLEMVQLQSEMMELRADRARPGKGFVLEGRIEKGRGSVATVIAQEGTISVGDFFVAGITFGKINSLVDSYGKSLKSVGPSIPVQIAGFDQLPEAGDYFEVVSQSQYQEARSSRTVQKDEFKHVMSEGAINILMKADTKSSKEALEESIEQLNAKNSKKIQIVYAGIGDISESDVELAHTTQAMIFGFHTKLELNAGTLAQKHEVSVQLFQVIYKLLDELGLLAQEKEVVKLVPTKIGEAIVKKIFEIKNVGTIAGAYVKEGRLARNGRFIVWRGRTKIAEGPIKSLERDRKSVKEVHTGFECAFLVEGFNDWAVDDRAECFLDLPAKG